MNNDKGHNKFILHVNKFSITGLRPEKILSLSREGTEKMNDKKTHFNIL